jgi:hypothetical protein
MNETNLPAGDELAAEPLPAPSSALDCMREAARHVDGDTLHPSDLARLLVATVAAVEQLAGARQAEPIVMPGCDCDCVGVRAELGDFAGLPSTAAEAFNLMLEFANEQRSLAERNTAANERIAGALEQLLASKPQ